MGFDLSEKRSYWELLLTPGPMITLVGLLILAVSIFFFATSSSGGSDIDALIDSQMKADHGQRLKSMIGLVVGTVVSIGGVLWSLLKFSRS